MVAASARPAGSSRNVHPNAAQQTAAPVTTVRIKNAKELRRAYVELNESPDGVDLEPLTIPKCVECDHCGYPVYPRESKIATKKTFARAGIERGTKKEEDAKRKAERLANGEEEADDADSVDSRDTVEKMADEIEELREQKEELEKKNEDLELQNEELTKELEETKELLEQHEERVEFLEEAELRWRDKLSQARLEIERLKTVLERSGMVAADRETGLVNSILAHNKLKEVHQAFVRRRNFMLVQLEQRWSARENEDRCAAILRLWRARAATDKLKRKLQELELRRQQEVEDLGTQLSLEKSRVTELKEQKTHLADKLREAAQRLLRRTLGRDHWPSALDHAFRAFVSMHPVNSLENALEFCQEELARVNQELADLTDKYEQLQEERDTLVRGGDSVVQQLETIKEELVVVKDQRDDLRDELSQTKALMKEKVEILEEEKEVLVEKIHDLEEKLADAEAAAMQVALEDGDKKDQSQDQIVKGEGIMCVSCLRQLVHRGVQPLPPVEALEVTAEKLEQAKKDFFEKEFSGIIDPTDEAHNHIFKARKDPYGLARLTLQPLGSTITSPTPPPAAIPTTGLPSLKKQHIPGSATALRASMREFKPRNFR
mmetsp:Transcript_74420/g.162800  ORF Transcript_74420/g.162800 Transcript_74420/m.162800 type:complete len:606 (-) Transcript_74420:51-1868(-)